MTATTSYGTLTDYATGEQIRPATAEEWRSTADAISFGTEQGIWEDENGRAVWVDGGPQAEVSDDDIRELRGEAAQAGDEAQASLCSIALGEDDGFATREAARAECDRVILDSRMQDE
jgi:hypothetical protein